jgi:hypothetical protein
MPFDNFIARAPGDAAHPFYPLPGAANDSYALEDGDGEAMTVVVNAARAEATADGRRTQRTAWSNKLKSTLAITDTRLVFASTDFLRGFKKVKGHSFVGHVRHEWLAAVTASDLRFAKSPNQVRVVLRDPVDSSWVDIVTFDIARQSSALSFATELVRRASAYRLQHTEGELAEPLVSTMKNGGTRWLLPNPADDQLDGVIDTVSSVRAEPLA